MCLERIFPKPCYFPDKRFQLSLGISECVRRTGIDRLGGGYRTRDCPIRRETHNPARPFRNSHPVAIRVVQYPIQREGTCGCRRDCEKTVHGLLCSYEALGVPIYPSSQRALTYLTQPRTQRFEFAARRFADINSQFAQRLSMLIARANRCLQIGEWRI